MNKIEILIIVPCYNEELRLPLDKFEEFISNYSNIFFLFVNDGSKDNTSELLSASVQKNSSNFFLLDLAKNCGKAEAVRHGMLEGLNQDRYDYIGFIDADLATPLEEIPYLISYANFFSKDKLFIFGSRIKLLGLEIERSTIRHYFGRISATGASICLSLPVYDTQCGIKLFHKNIIYKLFESPFSSRWLFDVEIFFRLKSLFTEIEFFKILIEVPLRKWREIPGTKIKLLDICRVPFELLKIYFRYNRNSLF
jgi:dolichyl-phosphate beta-glucosyltransferase